MNTKIFYAITFIALVLVVYMAYGLVHSKAVAKKQTHLVQLKALYQNLSDSHDPNVPLSTLVKFTDYPDCEVRREIISYRNISETVLNQMSKLDPDVGVRYIAKRRLDFLHGISHLEAEKHPLKPENPDVATWIKLASNCYVSDVLAHNIYGKSKKINGYPRTQLLMALALNPQTPPDILNELSFEKDLRILRKLAANPNLPAFLVQKFFPYPDCKIRKEILCHPNLTTVSVYKLQKDYDQSVSNQANQRLLNEESYLGACKEVTKINTSCQKYFGNTLPKVRYFPNISKENKVFKSNLIVTNIA